VHCPLERRPRKPRKCPRGRMFWRRRFRPRLSLDILVPFLLLLLLVFHLRQLIGVVAAGRDSGPVVNHTCHVSSHSRSRLSLPLQSHNRVCDELRARLSPKPPGAGVAREAGLDPRRPREPALVSRLCSSSQRIRVEPCARPPRQSPPSARRELKRRRHLYEQGAHSLT
jgi:hypothetical protein